MSEKPIGGGAYVLHSAWSQPRFFFAEDEFEAEKLAKAYIVRNTDAERVEYEKSESTVLTDEQWLEILLERREDWELDSGYVATE